MSRKTAQFPQDKTASERRKDLSDEEIKQLELAGGVEGGMQAGSAGGPGQSKNEKAAGAAKLAGQPKAK